jgi:hypothetical protein
VGELLLQEMADEEKGSASPRESVATYDGTETEIGGDGTHRSTRQSIFW